MDAPTNTDEFLEKFKGGVVISNPKNYIAKFAIYLLVRIKIDHEGLTTKDIVIAIYLCVFSTVLTCVFMYFRDPYDILG